MKVTKAFIEINPQSRTHNLLSYVLKNTITNYN